ncbi:hypothetical protein HK100_000618 [Physocladia obscura]|uniref:SH3 domain-containing protein n=1 Tax=Physocladia obscura TaxID=109957 RepID=A0AAD5XCF2_9FUNG|nr:hypothetical protein HK100_000618 [Physocladia obscura]
MGKELVDQCRKATEIMAVFVLPETTKMGMDCVIPADVITQARGVAVLQVVRAGFHVAGRFGSGLVVTRLDDGTWSAPSVIKTAGVGVGFVFGAEVTDVVMVLNTEAAVAAFKTSSGQLTLGGNLSVAAGPVGRAAEAALSVSLAKDKVAPIFSYSKTKGLMAGASFEGSAIIESVHENEAFYGKNVRATHILTGFVPRPLVAAPFYSVLESRITLESHAIPHPSNTFVSPSLSTNIHPVVKKVGTNIINVYESETNSTPIQSSNSNSKNTIYVNETKPQLSPHENVNYATLPPKSETENNSHQNAIYSTEKLPPKLPPRNDNRNTPHNVPQYSSNIETNSSTDQKRPTASNNSSYNNNTSQDAPPPAYEEFPILSDEYYYTITRQNPTTRTNYRPATVTSNTQTIYCVAVRDHVSTNPQYLQFRKGDSIRVLRSNDINGLLYGAFEKKEGLFPSDFVRKV